MLRGFLVIRCATALLSLTLAPSALAGKLDGVREQVHRDSQAGSSRSSDSAETSEADSYDSGDDATDSEDSFWGALLVSLFDGESSGSSGSVADRSGSSAYYVYLPYPYYKDQTSYLSVAEPSESDRNWSGTIQLDAGYVNEGVQNVTGRMRFRGHVIGFEAGFTSFIEHRDTLNLIDANGLLVFGGGPVLVSIGGGGRILLDPKQPPGEAPALGWNVVIDFDLFPVRPLIAALRLEGGSLGDAYLLHGRASLGVAIGPIEPYAGYDHWIIGGVHLGAPVIGARAWW